MQVFRLITIHARRQCKDKDMDEDEGKDETRKICVLSLGPQIVTPVQKSRVKKHQETSGPHTIKAEAKTKSRQTKKTTKKKTKDTR
jgi:hypothetical protein